MKIENWLALSENSCKLLENLNAKAFQKNEAVNNLIKKISSKVSEQWMTTHKNGIDQVEQGLTTQGKLMTQQYDMKKELSAMESGIRDTKLKMGTCQMLDESLLTQLGTPLLKIDPHYAENRKRQTGYANSVWSNGNDLRSNLDSMIRYRSDLSDRIQRMESNIKSNHNGINYDIKTIVNPRSHAVAVQPAIGLVQKSISAFE